MRAKFAWQRSRRSFMHDGQCDVSQREGPRSDYLVQQKDIRRASLVWPYCHRRQVVEQCVQTPAHFTKTPWNGAKHAWSRTSDESGFTFTWRRARNRLLCDIGCSRLRADNTLERATAMLTVPVLTNGVVCRGSYSTRLRPLKWRT